MQPGEEIESLVDELEQMVTEAKSPLTGGGQKKIVDAQDVYEILDEIRRVFPQEFQDARRILKADHQAIVDGGGTDGSAIGLRKLLGKPHATGAQIPQNAGRPGVPHVERSRGLPRHGSLNRKLDLADVAA